MEKYQKFFERKKLDRTKVENMIYHIYQNKIKKDLDDKVGYDTDNNYIKIIVFSPLFNLLSKIKNFENIFTICMNPIKKSKDNYIKIFNELNKLNKSLSICYKLYDINEFFLKELNINKIKN